MSPRDLELPSSYPQLLADLKATVQDSRRQAQRVVNSELLRLYWRLGDALLQRQRAEGWGARVIDRLANDLRAEFPDMKMAPARGLSQQRPVGRG